MFFILSIFILTGCNYFQTTEEYIKNQIDIDISFCTIEDDQDKHSGFLGDGYSIIKANCSKDYQKLLKQLNHWNKFPLSENLQLVMYGGERNGMIYAYHLAEEANIPLISNGYYYFLNRNSNVKEKDSDDLFSQYSFNFTLALYDIDTNLFYYYEYDT